MPEVSRLRLPAAAASAEPVEAAVSRGPLTGLTPRAPVFSAALLVINIDPAVPALDRRAALIEVDAGYGGAGPPLPPALAQAIRLLVAHAFEHRGDGAGDDVPPPALAALVAPLRRLRL